MSEPLNKITDNVQVMVSEVKDYVKKSIEFKQDIQKDPENNSKYQAKTPWVKLSSNAIKWMGVDDRKKLKTPFGEIEKEVVDGIYNFILDNFPNKIINISLAREDDIFNESRCIINHNKAKNILEGKSNLNNNSGFYEYKDTESDTSFNFDILYNTEFITVGGVVNNAHINEDENFLNKFKNLYIKNVNNFRIVTNNKNFGDNNSKAEAYNKQFSKETIKRKLKEIYNGRYTPNQIGNLDFLSNVVRDTFGMTEEHGVGNSFTFNLIDGSKSRFYVLIAECDFKKKKNPTPPSGNTNVSPTNRPLVGRLSDLGYPDVNPSDGWKTGENIFLEEVYKNIIKAEIGDTWRDRDRRFTSPYDVSLHFLNSIDYFDEVTKLNYPKLTEMQLDQLKRWGEYLKNNVTPAPGDKKSSAKGAFQIINKTLYEGNSLINKLGGMGMTDKYTEKNQKRMVSQIISDKLSLFKREKLKKEDLLEAWEGFNINRYPHNEGLRDATIKLILNKGIFIKSMDQSGLKCDYIFNETEINKHYGEVSGRNVFADSNSNVDDTIGDGTLDFKFIHNNKYKVSLNINPNEYFPRNSISIAIPSKVFHNLISTYGNDFFSMDQDILKKIKLLTLLHHIIYNGAVITSDEFSKIHGITISEHVQGKDIEKILNAIKPNEEYAKKHVLNSIDYGFNLNDPNDKHNKSEFGGFHIYEKDSQLGIRPPAGVVSISVETQGKFGILRKASVNLKAFTLTQLEMIQNLYLRPGIFLFLEWGWSLYPSNIDKISDLRFIENDKSGKFFNFEGHTDYINSTTIEDAGNKNKVDTHGHYDFMFGIISNFSWNMNEYGEYDINITLISSTASLLALEMSNNNSNRESIFSINIFDNFKKYFNVISVNNVNDDFKLLKTYADTLDIGHQGISFLKFDVIDESLKSGMIINDRINDLINTDKDKVSDDRNKILTSIVYKIYGAIENTDTENMRDVELSTLAIPLELSTPEKNPDDYVSITNESNPLLYAVLYMFMYKVNTAGGTAVSREGNRISIIEKGDKENTIKIKNETVEKIISEKYPDIDTITSYFKKYNESGGRVYYDDKIETFYLPIPHVAEHEIKFPNINKAHNLGFSTETCIEYLKKQGIYDGSILSILEYFNQLDGSLKNPITFCSTDGIMYNDTELYTYPVDESFMEQLKYWQGTNRSEDEKLGVRKKSDNKDFGLIDITIKALNDSLYNSLKTSYKMAYQYYVDNIYNITQDIKLSDDEIRSIIEWAKIVIVETDQNILRRFVRNPHLTVLKGTGNKKLGGLSYNYNAASELYRLLYFKSSADYAYEWNDKDKSDKVFDTYYDDKEGVKLIDAVYGSVRFLKFNDINLFSEESNVKITEKTDILDEAKEAKLIEMHGGNRPFYITLKCLLSLLTDSIVYKQHEPDNLIIFKSDLSNIEDLKNNPIIGDDVKKIPNDNPDKYKNLIREIVDKANDSIKGVKNSLFKGFYTGKQVPTRKIDDLMSIHQTNVVFLTKKIVEKNKDLFKKNIDFFKKISVDNVDVDNVKENNDILESCYIACKFINETIKKSNTIDSFIRTIFGEIQEASGKFIDLIALEDKLYLNKNKLSGYIFKICDRKYNDLIVESSITVDTASESYNIVPFKFNVMSNNSIVNQISFGAKLPTSFQRVAFVAASAPTLGNSSGMNTVNNVLNNFSNQYVNNINKIVYLNGRNSEYELNASVLDSATRTNSQVLDDLKSNPLDYSIVSSDNGVSDFSAYYANFLENSYVTKNMEYQDELRGVNNNIGYTYVIPPIGLELSFKIEGISGIEWGNLIKMDYLPKSIEGSIFQITSITDEVNGDYWNTSIKCVLRSITELGTEYEI